MQKHERLIVQVAQEEAAKFGLSVRFEHGGKVKGQLHLERDGHHVADRPVAATPRNADDYLRWIRQWVRRKAAGEKHHGH